MCSSVLLLSNTALAYAHSATSPSECDDTSAITYKTHTTNLAAFSLTEHRAPDRRAHNASAQVAHQPRRQARVGKPNPTPTPTPNPTIHATDPPLASAPAATTDTADNPIVATLAADRDALPAPAARNGRLRRAKVISSEPGAHGAVHHPVVGLAGPVANADADADADADTASVAR